MSRVSSGLEAKFGCADAGLLEVMPSSEGLTGVAEVERPLFASDL